ncbi:MAG TPA: hypothetical protein VL523_07430 [Terriglobia bacterium]|nr:hypothetical protein [Terriglobia bacterium]
MNTSPQLARFHLLERVSPTHPAIGDVEAAVRDSLGALGLDPRQLAGRRIAVAVGSRGVASLREIVRAVCRWLARHGAKPFAFPAMGSHGGATDAGQRRVLEDYGVTPEFIGAEVLSSMASIQTGTTPEGFPVSMDRHAWQSDGVVLINRVKPHTSFTGRIESGLLKMLAVGMGKEKGAREFHRLAARYGAEPVLRAVGGAVLATGKILAGVAVAENSCHQAAVIRAATPEGMVAMEEEMLALAKSLLPRLPFSRLDLLIVDEIGKNVSGAGMDTKVIGRGMRFAPGDAPEIRLIYARDLTDESAGNGLGVGLADFIHERLFRKIDFEKMYVNGRTSLNTGVVRLPMWFRSDREALEFGLRALGDPLPAGQHVVAIRNTLSLDCILVSEPLAAEAASLPDWRVSGKAEGLEFDGEGNFPDSVMPVLRPKVDSGGAPSSQ